MVAEEIAENPPIGQIVTNNGPRSHRRLVTSCSAYHGVGYREVYKTHTSAGVYYTLSWKKWCNKHGGASLAEDAT